jgi:hypothetical protein
MDGAKKGASVITLIEDSDDDSDQDVSSYDDLQESEDEEIDGRGHRDKNRESPILEYEQNDSLPNDSNPKVSEPNQSESNHLLNSPTLNESKTNLWIPHTRFGDLFLLPLSLLKALVYFYDSDEWTDRIEGLSPTWYYATPEEEAKERLILLKRVKRMLKSQRQDTCITTILSLYFGADNISITNYLTPLRDAIESCKAYVSHTLPLYLEKARKKIEQWEYSSGDNSLSDHTPYASLFVCGTPKDCTNYHKSMTGNVTHGFDKLCEEINERRLILTRLLKDVHPDQECLTPISYPVWLPICIALIPCASVHHLIPHNCFHLFRTVHHTERDYDVIRSLLLVASIDCYLSKMPQDKDRFSQIVISLNHCVYSYVMSNLFQSSDNSSRDDRARYQLAQQHIKCKDMIRIKPPLDHHFFSHNSDDKINATSPSVPHLNALENLFTPSTWETMEQSSIPQNIDRLTQITRQVCTWSKGFDSKSGCVVVDQGRQNVMREEIKMMGEDSILNRAMSIAAVYEVIRCFHVSPVVVNYDGKAPVDLRSKGKETAKACILLIMLSTVRNVVFRSSRETNCDTVIITSRARDGYEKKQCDLNLEFGSSSSIVLSGVCLERVLTAIQKKEDIVI